jgi:hypothetical protein
MDVLLRCRPPSLPVPVDSADRLPPSNSGSKDACEVNLDSRVCFYCAMPKQPGEHGDAEGLVSNVGACSKYRT